MPTPSDSIAILYWVQEVSDAVDEQLGPVAADAALTLPQFHLLYYVVERGPMRLGELAKRQRCVKSNVSNLVRTMAEKDLVAVR
ncbi:MAG: MarR family transcriptional regulator, partial [Myxococcota bacterium]